eukprot:scaffold16632_cov18-Prasinocladus_malaysianus.AAC.1
MGRRADLQAVAPGACPAAHLVQEEDRAALVTLLGRAGGAVPAGAALPAHHCCHVSAGHPKGWGT